MKRIGITGGIGSGKTTVCGVFETLGVSVFYADKVAHSLQQTDNKIRSGLIEIFGQSVYSPDGIPDRTKMAELIFSDPELKLRVNKLIHPAVKENFLDWLAGRSREDYVLYEAAIIFETNSFKGFDYNILVIASEELRIRRVMQRDNISRQAVMERIRNQMPDEEKIVLADFIIDNNEEKLIIPQVIEIDSFLKNH